MKPKKERIVETLQQTHYPDIAAARQSTRFGEQLPEVDCTYPAIFLMTRTVKQYKSMMYDPSVTVEDENGNQVPAPSEEIGTDHSNVIGAKYTCVQCRITFMGMQEFKQHLLVAQDRIAKNSLAK